jgi:hypothetical protein
MKAKLIKTEVNYLLKNEEGVIIASTSIKKGISSLSKENCNELFGVVDVEKLADELKVGISYKEYDHLIKRGIIVGFNKAMELNKDKVFTLEDVILIAEYVRVASQSTPNERTKNLVDEYLSTQPTEINVEIIMKNSRTGKIIKSEADLEWGEDGLCDRAIPKLDSEGCLILKRVV